MKSLRIPLLALVAFASLAAASFGATPPAAPANAPIKALLITGGGFHDYDFQRERLVTETKKLANIEWTVVHEGGRGTRAQISLYDNPNWAKPYDVVVHNECFADTTDPEYIRKITAAHKAGTPSVVIHCAMHTYRAAQVDDWREFLGVTTRRHDHQSKYPVRVTEKDHFIMRGFPAEWTTPMDELYVIEKLWPNSKALAFSKSERDGKDHPVIWVNDYYGTRVAGTTYGHGNVTWEDPVFIRYVTQSILWAAGRDK